MSDLEVYEQDGYRLTINRPWCKGCELCVKSCPMEILRLDGEAKVVVSDISRCIFCGICELRCPDFAIHVEKPAHAAGGLEEKKAEQGMKV